MSLNLFFECLSEEMPYKIHNDIIQQCHNNITSKLLKSNINYQTIEVFITTRRLTLCVNNITINETKKNGIKGPRINAPNEAIKGFLRKFNAKKEELVIQKIKEEDFYFFTSNNSKQDNLEELLQTTIESFLHNFYWQKSMRWGNSKIRWVRPIISLLCILGNKILPVQFLGLTASNITKGHRFLSDDKNISINDFIDYQEKLKSNYVILNQTERLNFILQQIQDLTSSNGLKCEDNLELLNDLNGIVEYPIVIMGSVDKKFFDLPKELVLSVMHNQQHYLAVYDIQNRITNFITVVNLSNIRIIKDHEKVLTARLTDADFLINHDKKQDLNYYIKKLGNIVFHAKLGSISEKVYRVTTLAKAISLWIPKVSLIQVERASQLSKFDLATSIVKEFPELQGVMGRYYAKHFGEEKEIYESIMEYYYPVNQTQKCQLSPISIALSIADKIDTLVGLTTVGEKVSGSRDPFALRRTAISIVRLIIENNIYIPIRIIIEKSASLYYNFLFKKNNLNIEKNISKIPKNKDSLIATILNFLYERFFEILRKNNIRNDVIDAVTSHKVDNFTLLQQKCITLNQYLKTDYGTALLFTYKRASNILNKTIKAAKFNTLSKKKYSKSLLIEQSEIILAKEIDKLYNSIKFLIKKNQLLECLEILYKLNTLINQFMDTVRINDFKELQENRLSIVNNICAIFNLVTDFSKIKNI